MFKKLLIANRGEIALRIMRACKELGISTVAVHSEADSDSLHVKLADESVCIGPPPAGESYLRVTRLLAAAEITGAEAIHPGYGFLAENADFAEMCLEHNFVWVGPRPELIRLMGDKVRARETMRDAGVPLVPGSEGDVNTVGEAVSVGNEIGFPIMLKATGGGGGRGMRLVRDREELEEAFPMAQHEADVSFNNPSLYLERFVERARHVEVQILGDREGSVIHMGERDCTVQRRHQKLIEEAPSPAVDEEIRRDLTEAAVKGAKHLGYDSVGTTEFLLDEDGSFYFMEMNTRIQVEHPVTELVTGLDLIRAQIRRAAGEPLPFGQEDIRMNGHAIECRINAEDPARDFAPCPGPITYYHAPGGPGIRVDSHVYSGYSIGPHYDSLIAKVICHGRTRDEAIIRMRRALEECIIEGVKSTLGFHLEVMNHPVFQSGRFTTRFLEENRIFPETAGA